jgi:universal stress protein E
MSRRTKWPASVNVMCSIDVGSTDEHQIALDKHIFAFAKDDLNDHLPINLHLASVISLSRVSQELELVDKSEVLLKEGPSYREKLNAFDQDHAVSDSKLLLAAGVPSKQICSLAKKKNMDLVVIGNVGRKGLTGMIIGNTAEKILKNITSDVLVVNGNIQ